MYAIVLCLACGNPAPIYKERVEHVTPGHYTMSWASPWPIIYNLELKADGSLEAKLGSYISYIGYWSYDQKTRLFSLQERRTPSNEVSIDWYVLFDTKLDGKGVATWACDQSQRNLKVTLRRVKKQ